MAATKRKTAPDFYRRFSSHDQPKRLSLGRGSSEKYHQHGKELARQGKYEEALKVLGEALLQEDADANRTNIYDSRSAIYCKLGQYRDAVSDANGIIIMEPKTERGYLRAGKALLLDNKAKEALDIYDFGLNAMEPDNPRREAVVKVREKLLAKMLSWLRDPIKHLNNDCLLEIFKYLSFRQIVAMTRLSKTWRAYIRSQTYLWNDISFKGARPLVSVETMQACIQKSRGRVKRLQLCDMDHPSDALLQASKCSRLEYLDVDLNVEERYISQYLSLQSNLKTLILSKDAAIRRNGYCELLRLPNLERFESYRYIYWKRPDMKYVDHVVNLKTLVLDIKGIDRPSYFRHPWLPEHVPDFSSILQDLENRNSYFERAPKLEELRIAATMDMDLLPYERLEVCLNDICHPNLRTLDISHAKLTGTWSFPGGLEYLRLDQTMRQRDFFITGPGFTELPNLKTVILTNLEWLGGPDVLRFLFSNNGSLETLRIESCEQIKKDDLKIWTMTCSNAMKNLKTLSLTGMGLYNFEDGNILDLFPKMPQLEELHLPNTSVTGVLIKRISLFQGNPNGALPIIKYINVKGCQNVSYEAADWGRRAGIKVVTR